MQALLTSFDSMSGHCQTCTYNPTPEQLSNGLYCILERQGVNPLEDIRNVGKACIYHKPVKAAYQEKREAKIARYEDLAAKAREESSQLFDQAHRMADVIPFGQPILVGHHSEGRDRNYRAKIDGKYNKAFEADKKAAYYEQKARAAENNKSISSDDPEAVDKLKEKLTKLEKLQEQMKIVNKIIRKKITDEEKIKELCALSSKITEERAKGWLKPDFCGRVGIPSYALQNNNAEISRLKKRIATLDAKKDDITSSFKIGEIEIIDSVEDNRLQVFFPGIPEEKIREQLKANGFRWSPYNKCWQSYRGEHYIMRIKDILKVSR
jgi:hypothetical protein